MKQKRTQALFDQVQKEINRLSERADHLQRTAFALSDARLELQAALDQRKDRVSRLWNLRRAMRQMKVASFHGVKHLTRRLPRVAAPGGANRQEVLEHIRKAAVPLRLEARAIGIYFLLNGSECTYVGQSVNVYRRILDHLEERTFDAACYLPCSRQSLNTLERHYIDLLLPSDNTDTRTASLKRKNGSLPAHANRGDGAEPKIPA